MQEQGKQAWMRRGQSPYTDPNDRARLTNQRGCSDLHPGLLQRVRAAAEQTGDLRDAVVIALLASGQLCVSDLPRLQIEHLTWDGSQVLISQPGADAPKVPVRLSPGDSTLLADYLAERASSNAGAAARWPARRRNPHDNL